MDVLSGATRDMLQEFRRVLILGRLIIVGFVDVEKGSERAEVPSLPDGGRWWKYLLTVVSESFAGTTLEVGHSSNYSSFRVDGTDLMAQSFDMERHINHQTRGPVYVPYKPPLDLLWELCSCAAPSQTSSFLLLVRPGAP